MAGKTFSKAVLTLGLLLVFSASVFAGTTGKIEGKVVDQKTGNPLPGVNVIIMGTQMGASTDINGHYFVNNVPVGRYALKASMIGYTPQIVKNIMVSADLSTSINFRLEPTVLQVGKPIVVTAERPLVEKDITSTTRIVTPEEFMRQPIRTFNGVIASTAGVDGTHFRGGMGNDIAWMVDGLQVDDPLSGGQAVTLSNIAIEEVQVITGGFNAEYGEAMSGVVNVITKSGGPRLSAFYRYTTDNGTNLLSKDLDFDYDSHELSLGGPVPFTNKKIRFFTSLVLGLQGVSDPRKMDNQIQQLINEGYKMPYGLDANGNRVNDFLTLNPKIASNKYWLNHNRRQRYETTWKFTYNVSPGLQLRFGGFYERNQWERYPFSGTGQTPERSYYWVAENYTNYLRMNSQFYLGISHQINSRTFYEFTINRFETNYKTGLVDGIWKKDANGKYLRDSNGNLIVDQKFHWWQDYKFFEPTWKPLDPKEYRKQKWQNPFNPFGVYNNWQTAGASTRRYEQRFLSYYGAKFTLTSQITQHHQLKTGFEGRLHKAVRHYNSLPWRPDPFRNDYEVHPQIFNAYFQDTAEWPGLIVNAGVRFDYMNPEKEHRSDKMDRFSPLVPTEPKWKISPRLGISHPITDRTVLHFQYGKFFQSPDFLDLYANLDPDVARSYDYIGNPDMNPLKTTAYELGITHQLGLNSKIEITGYFKDMYDLQTIRYIPVVPNPISKYDNRQYGDAKGIEFTFTKRLSNFWATQATYSLSQARTMAFSTANEFVSGETNPETGIRYYFPEKLFPTGYDRTHIININFDFRLPKKSGPKIAGFYPLENSGINIITRSRSGTPYTRTNYKGETVEERNSSRRPWYFNMDMRLTRDFNLFGMHAQLFMEIFNVTNRTNILNVYSYTQDPIRTGEIINEQSFKDGISEGDPTWKWQKVKDLNHDGHISQHEEYLGYLKSFHFLRRTASNFGPPRIIHFGFQINY
ncbi:vitamin B12 transporter BtuB [bacterium BMS3Abin05]|nr:vitamin B12 transporter BtuB [bacterium BMS3Abin05]GBE28337.1 vitamin B12 transporter BtuB [bacterium BMS3Bbin03]